MAVYEHSDGSHSAYCWVCQSSTPEFDFDNMEASTGKSSTKKEIKVSYNLPTVEEVREDYFAVSNPDRKIPASYYEKYGVCMELQGDGETIERVFYPTYREEPPENNTHVGYRIRGRFPEGHKDEGVLKDFGQGAIGDTKKGIQLFGEWVFDRAKHKRLILTEGEEDAICGNMMTDKHKGVKVEGGYAVMSLPSGANIAGIKSRLEYISKYDEIYLNFDNDSAGKAVLEKALKILPVGKVRIVELPNGYKDNCDLWKAAKNKADRGKSC